MILPPWWSMCWLPQWLKDGVWTLEWACKAQPISPASSFPKSPPASIRDCLLVPWILLIHSLVSFERGLPSVWTLLSPPFFNPEDPYLPFKLSSKVTFSGKEVSLSPSSLLPEHVFHAFVSITRESASSLVVSMFILHPLHDQGFCAVDLRTPSAELACLGEKTCITCLEYHRAPLCPRSIALLL